jgi:hypothetical protein
MLNNNLVLIIFVGIVVMAVLHMTSKPNVSKSKVSKSKEKFVSSESTPVDSSENFSEHSPIDNLEGMQNVDNVDNSDNVENFGESPTSLPVPKAESVIKSSKLGNNFGGGKFSTKLTGAGSNVGPNTTNVNGLSLEGGVNDYTLGVTPVISKEKKAKKLSAKDLLPKESQDDWFDMPYDKKQMMRIENENLLAGSSTQSRIGIDTQGQTLRNASHDLRAAPLNPKFNVGPWLNSTIEPDYNIKPIM